MDIPRTPPNRRIRTVLSWVGAGGFLALTAVVAFLDPPPPSVSRSDLWFDTVQAGEFVREVRGSGTLVPIRSILITASVSGQVEAILVENGAMVQAGTPLIELSNPDLVRDAAAAVQELIELEARRKVEETNHSQEELTLGAAVQEAFSSHQEALRQAEVDAELLRAGVIPAATERLSRERAATTARRLETEEQRRELRIQSLEAQRLAAAATLERQIQAAVQRRDRPSGLVVRAELDGIVQGIDLDIGQSVGAYQTLGRIVEPDRLKAALRIPEVQVRDVLIGQPGVVDTRLGIARGRVGRVDPTVQEGTVAVDIYFDEPLPVGVRPDLAVTGVIELERIDDALQIGRPPSAASGRTIRLFRLTPDRSIAERVDVEVGRISAGSIEVLSGLKSEDLVILSDMSSWAEYDRLRIR